jgi:drug/metabolite transporter (DMT)-like permease
MTVLMPHLSLGAASTQGERFGALLGVMAACFVALTQVYVRKLVRTESMAAIVFYFSLSSALVSLVTLPFGWVAPQGADLAILIACGLIGGLGQILMTSSFRFAEVSLLAPFDYTSMIFSLVIGYFVFGEATSVWTFIGGSVVALAGILIVLREKRLGLDQDVTRRVGGS